jgi:glycosyltransferase involved in cell wall biosynthesis
MEKWSIALADSVITVNRACARLFSTRSCSADKITVVMNSPDERIFVQPPPSLAAEKRNADRPFVVMYHGSLVERNGLGLAVDALAKISSTLPAVQLRIYGSRNAFLDRVMASVQKRGLERSVQYLGARSLEDIVEAIKECDLGIVPNERSIFTEINTPTRLFEYLALGKPVVAPRAPGILDYFDEESLIFFELGNAEDLARKIEFAFHNPDRIREITERGRQVHLTHTWSSERRILTGLVTDLLSNGVVPVSQQPTETISRKHARSPR